MPVITRSAFYYGLAVNIRVYTHTCKLIFATLNQFLVWAGFEVTGLRPCIRSQWQFNTPPLNALPAFYYGLAVNIRVGFLAVIFLLHTLMWSLAS